MRRICLARGCCCMVWGTTGYPHMRRIEQKRRKERRAEGKERGEYT
jgi:hypothetical protein